MQAKEVSASINAKFTLEPNKLEAIVQGIVQGNHVAVCFLLGQLILNVAKSAAKMNGISESQALEDVFRIVKEAAHFTLDSGFVLDLSHKTKED